MYLRYEDLGRYIIRYCCTRMHETKMLPVYCSSRARDNARQKPYRKGGGGEIELSEFKVGAKKDRTKFRNKSSALDNNEPEDE